MLTVFDHNINRRACCIVRSRAGSHDRNGGAAGTENAGFGD
jgi:hypothetical protein